jgi:hypothetical protein
VEEAESSCLSLSNDTGIIGYSGRVGSVFDDLGHREDGEVVIRSDLCSDACGKREETAFCSLIASWLYVDGVARLSLSF